MNQYTQILQVIIDNPNILEVGREAIEEVLIDRRDSRICLIGRGNGLVVREKDAKDSYVIRMGPEEALVIGLNAIKEYLDKNQVG